MPTSSVAPVPPWRASDSATKDKIPPVSDSVTLPFWLAAVLAAAAAWLLLERLLVPSVRWVLRRRVNRVLDEVDRRLAIRVQPFKLTRRRTLIDRLMYDSEVQEAAQAFGEEHDMPREVVMQKVGVYAREIVPAFNAYVYFRLGYWLARRTARTLFRVRLGYSNEEELAAIEPDSTVVFVMNHRSNMDYVLISYLAAERTALSYAVGEWARIFPLESLVRSMGAYFVRRRSHNDLYRKVLARYVAMATREGVTQAVYPEGQLSRDGRVAEPKLGLLDYMLRSFDPAGRRDLVFVPVALNYDRVLEDRTLLLDVEPEARRRRGLAAVWTTWTFFWRNFGLWVRGQWHRFGYACVNFGSPLSLKTYLGERGLDLRQLDRRERFGEVAVLARELLDRVGRVMPVVPVALVAAVLAARPGRRWTRLELKAAVARQMAELADAGAHVYVPRRDDDYTIDVGLRMLVLRRILVERDGLLEVPVTERPIVSYYARSIEHLGTEPEPLTATG